MPGPLSGVRVVELAGLGPAPFCGMVLCDLGAEVVRVDRADIAVGDHTSSSKHDLHNRGKRSIGLNLKTPDAVEVVLGLVERSDILIEGFRPGVTERLGIGPAQCLAANTTLVYGPGGARRDHWPPPPVTTSTTSHFPACFIPSDLLSVRFRP